MKHYEQEISRLLSLLVNSGDADCRMFGILLADQKRQFTTEVGTMAVDGRTFYVNPSWFLSRSDFDNLFTMLHEAVHVGSRHPERLRDLPHDRNLVHKAADYAVNLTLEQSSQPFPMPDDGLIDRSYVDDSGRALNTERIIPLLMQQQEQPEQSSGQQSGSNDQQSTSDDQSASDSGTGDDQSSITGEKTPESCGELLPAPDDLEASDTAEQIVRAATLARSAGDGLSDAVLELVNNAVDDTETDWLTLFRDRFATAVDNSDYSYRKLNHDYARIGLIMPTLYSDAIGRVAIVGDESSSMSARDLQHVTEQTLAIIEEWQPREVEIVRHTSKVVYTEELSQGQEPSDRDKIARGGTRFQPVIDHLAENRPDVVIWVTDCEFFDDPQEPDFPCIFLGTRESAGLYHRRCLGFGDYVTVA